MYDAFTSTSIATFLGFTLTTVGLVNAIVFSKFNEVVLERKTKLNQQIGKCKDLVNTRDISEQRSRLLNININFLQLIRKDLKYIPRELNILEADE